MRRGDLIYTFVCPTKTARIREATECFNDIPIESDPPIFVDPVSRTAKLHSAAVPCSKRMPMMIQTENQWVELSPHLRRATAPANTFPMDETNVEHEDVTHSGIYTAAELEEWNLITQYPSYQKALVNEIALGSCSVTGRCGYQSSSSTPGIQPYDLNQLLQKSIDSLDIWEQVDRWIMAKGAYLAALVLLLTMAQWLLNIILLSMALILSLIHI